MITRKMSRGWRVGLCFAGVVFALVSLPAFGGTNAPSPEAVARVLLAQVEACEELGIESRFVTPAGAVVTIMRSFGPGVDAGNGAAAPGVFQRHRGAWTVAASLAGLLLVDRVAAPNGWLWHRGGEDWAGFVTKDSGAVETKSSGSQTTDGGGNNYYAEGDVYVQHGDRGVGEE